MRGRSRRSIPRVVAENHSLRCQKFNGSRCRKMGRHSAPQYSGAAKPIGVTQHSVGELPEGGQQRGGASGVSRSLCESPRRRERLECVANGSLVANHLNASSSPIIRPVELRA